MSRVAGHVTVCGCMPCPLSRLKAYTRGYPVYRVPTWPRSEVAAMGAASWGPEVARCPQLQAASLLESASRSPCGFWMSDDNPLFSFVENCCKVSTINQKGKNI
jgi:hypothetical protein